MFELQFETDNAAFEEALTDETARILKDIAAKLEGGREGGFVMDANGNNAGEWELS